MTLKGVLGQVVPHLELPPVKAGDAIVVHQKIVEGGKERVQAFEGMVLKVHKPKSLDGTFTVRKMSFGVGVEKTYPLFSPNIVKIEFKKEAPVRRARLYYLRGLAGKALRLKEKATDRKTWYLPGKESEREKTALVAKKELPGDQKKAEAKAKEREAKENEKS